MSFSEVFAPGLRHLREERERQRHDVVHPKQGGPPFGVDLEAGTARFTLPPAPSADSSETSTGTSTGTSTEISDGGTAIGHR